MRNIKIYALIIALFIGNLFTSCNKAPDVDNSAVYIEKNEFDSHESKSNIPLVNNRETISRNFDFLPSSTTKQIVKHQYYTLSYNESHEQSEWVAYELKKVYIKNNNFKRPFFIEDVKVKTGSADWRNYKNTIYDKGHLCPAGDMEFNLDAYNDTFFSSNISPQKRSFNNGVWNRLEQKVRYWAVKYDGIYVITGGVLDSSLTTIGREKVSVPEYFFKILLDDSGEELKMIGFLVPNAESNKPLYSFVVSVDHLEKLTGIDFFPKLNDNIENQLERRNDYKNWSFN